MTTALILTAGVLVTVVISKEVRRYRRQRMARERLLALIEAYRDGLVDVVEAHRAYKEWLERRLAALEEGDDRD